MSNTPLLDQTLHAPRTLEDLKQLARESRDWALISAGQHSYLAWYDVERAYEETDERNYPKPGTPVLFTFAFVWLDQLQQVQRVVGGPPSLARAFNVLTLGPGSHPEQMPIVVVPSSILWFKDLHPRDVAEYRKILGVTLDAVAQRRRAEELEDA
jgi:hypothetical protein